jgi:hypothetical protein
MDLGNLQGLIGREQGQQTRQAGRQHRFARTRWADHQQVVAACRRDLERLASEGLTTDLGQVG